MAKYIPTSNGIKYCYVETANGEQTLIKSSWEVELSSNETIEIQEATGSGTHIYTVELKVLPTGGPAGDHTWNGTALVTICPDKEYDPTAVTELSDKQNKVRDKIFRLLSFYRVYAYEVRSEVSHYSLANRNKGTDTVSGSATIEIS